MTQLPVGGPAATTYRVTSRAHVTGRVATPAYLVTDGRAAEGGPSQQVYYVSDAEIAAGEFIVAGDVHPIPIVAVNNVNAEYPPIPIYVVNATVTPPLPVFRVAADGSGSYLTIEAALTAAPATGGAIISIKDGTYAAAGGAALEVSKPGLQLIGDSRAGVIINAPLSATNGIIVTADDVLLKSFTLDGRRAAGGAGVGIAITQAQRTVIDDCLIENTLGQGILISGSPIASDYGEIKNCPISNLATNGVSRVTGAFACGIQILGGGNRWSIHDNTITGWSQAIGLWYSSSYCEVYSNNCHDNYGYWQEVAGSTRSAIEVYPADTVGGHHLIHDNTIDGSTSCCIESAQGDNSTTYSNNTCSNWNAFSDNTGGPISIVDGGIDQQNINVVVSGNTFNAPNRPGYVLLAGRSVTFSGNALNNFIYSGITSGTVYIYTGFAGQPDTVTGNTLTNCRGGVYFGSGNGHTASSNVFASPASNLQILSVAAGDNHIIRSNTTTGRITAFGISLLAGSGHTVQDNNLNLGLRAMNIAAANCTIGGNGHGNTFYSSDTIAAYVINVSGAGATGNVITYNTITAGDAWGAVGFVSGATGNTLQYNTLTGAVTPGTGNTIGPNP